MTNPEASKKLNITSITSMSNEPFNDESAAAINAVSDLLIVIGNAFFLVFLAYVVVDSFPLELLNPQWQFGFISRLLGSGYLALIGFASLHIAGTFNPANRLARHRLDKVRQLAVIAAIGFFLLIPLQGFATWNAYNQAKATQETQLQEVNKRLAPLKQAINSATSTTDLQQRLARLQEFRIQLRPEDLRLPLDTVKNSLLSNVERTQNMYKDRLSGPKPSNIWTIGQSLIRNLMASIGYFFGFAAGAQPKNSSHTLLKMLSSKLSFSFGRNRRRSRRT